jgi:DNA-binding winged helix-turn-helix (wHTH) protein
MHSYYILNGRVEFHPATGTLRSLDDSTSHIELNSPASRCLLLLIKRKGTVVGQQEMMNEVWHKSGSHVTPNTYYQNISILRRGFKSVGISEEVVITVPRVGVTLSASVTIDYRESTTPALFQQEEELYTTQSPERKDDLLLQFVNINTSSEENFASRPQTEIEPPVSNLSIPGNRNNVRNILYAAGVILIILAAWGATQFNDSVNIQDYEYTKIGDIGHCKIYYDTISGSLVSKEEVIQWANRFSQDCVKHPYLYISLYKILPRASVIRCDTEIIAENECISEYFIEGTGK